MEFCFFKHQQFFSTKKLTKKDKSKNETNKTTKTNKQLFQQKKRLEVKNYNLSHSRTQTNNETDNNPELQVSELKNLNSYIAT